MINQLHNENCLDTMKLMEDNSIDAIVTDPPYGLSFMGKKWDYNVPSIEIWKECLRVLKPGGHLLSFAGTRTQHRMCVNIEDAGFEIRDMIAWVYGSGFPKSLNVSKAIDKSKGVEREVVGKSNNHISESNNNISTNTQTYGTYGNDKNITTPATVETQKWDGWGTALKPALEPITVARKPLSEKTIAANVLKWGTGAINIKDCRISLNGGYKSKANGRPSQTGLDDNYKPEDANQPDTQGRFPANFIHDGSQLVLDLFPDSKDQSGSVTGNEPSASTNNVYGDFNGRPATNPRGDKGSAARFFYCAKTSKKDRDEGLEDLPKKKSGMISNTSDQHMTRREEGYEVSPRANNHPTVKPTKLMQYLCRLITPPNGLIYDPFTGSGSTGKAAILEGFQFIGSELEKEYCEIAKKRIGL